MIRNALNLKKKKIKIIQTLIVIIQRMIITRVLYMYRILSEYWIIRNF